MATVKKASAASKKSTAGKKSSKKVVVAKKAAPKSSKEVKKTAAKKVAPAKSKPSATKSAPAKKKVVAPAEAVDEGIMSFLKSEPPKKKWNPGKDSRVVSNRKDDEAWIKLLLDKHRRGIELTDREWNSIQQWKLKRDMKGEDAAGVGIITKQNSTVDVNKGTPRKNLKAFRLVK
jgi:hypothetical protein